MCSSAGNHLLVFTFSNNVVSGSANVTGGVGMAGTSSFVGHTMAVGLSGVADAQKITVTLQNVTDGFGQVLPDIAVSANMLIGDVNSNKNVNATDVSQTKLQSGAGVTAANFRADANAGGSINATDVAIVKANSGHGVP
jgi:hypothetical protein